MLRLTPRVGGAPQSPAVIVVISHRNNHTQARAGAGFHAYAAGVALREVPRCHPWSGRPYSARPPHQALHASSAAHAARPLCPSPGFLIIKGGRQTLGVPSQPHCLSIRGVLIVAWELTVISELRCQTHGRRVCCPPLGSPLRREAQRGSSCTPSHLPSVCI